MQYLTYVYVIGGIGTLVMALRAMATPMATQKEIQGMTYNYTALGNFMGNLFALTVITVFWPAIIASMVYSLLRGK